MKVKPSVKNIILLGVLYFCIVYTVTKIDRIVSRVNIFGKMDALVKLEECTDYITITNGGTEHRVKVVGTTDTPYFCGMDVCEVLGHKDAKWTLYCQVDAEYRVSLKEIEQNKLKEVGWLSHPTSIGQNNLKNLTYHTGKAIYLSESGLYQLVQLGW